MPTTRPLPAIRGQEPPWRAAATGFQPESGCREAQSVCQLVPRRPIDTPEGGFAHPYGYNLDRSHQGYRLRGRTPAQALREALGIEELPPLVPSGDQEGTEGPEPIAA